MDFFIFFSSPLVCLLTHRFKYKYKAVFYRCFFYYVFFTFHAVGANIRLLAKAPAARCIKLAVVGTVRNALHEETVGDAVGLEYKNKIWMS